MNTSAVDQLEQFLSQGRLRRIDDVISKRTANITLVLDGVHGAHNISAVLRSADAFGIQHVYLLGSDFSHNTEISLGTERWVDLHRYQEPTSLLSYLRQEGYMLVVLQAPDRSTFPSTSIPVHALPFEQKLALVFGNEKSGVQQALAAEADLFAHIPMFGFVESLNVSVAAAIAMYCSLIASASGTRERTPLPDSEQTALRKRWLQTGVKNSASILAELDRRNSSRQAP